MIDTLAKSVFHRIKNIMWSISFDLRFLRTKSLMYIFNHFPNLYTLKSVKNIILRSAGMKVGNAYLVTPLYVGFAGNVYIGNGTFVNIGVHFEGNAKTEIGRECQIGPFCKFETTNHVGDNEEYLPIKVGDNVWMGAGCILLPGVVIGDNTVVAAGTMVKGEIRG